MAIIFSFLFKPEALGYRVCQSGWQGRVHIQYTVNWNETVKVEWIGSQINSFDRFLCCFLGHGVFFLLPSFNSVYSTFDVLPLIFLLLLNIFFWCISPSNFIPLFYLFCNMWNKQIQKQICTYICIKHTPFTHTKGPCFKLQFFSFLSCCYLKIIFFWCV